MVTLERAKELVFQAIQAVGTDYIPIIEGYGRILAAPVKAKVSVPPFDRSALDGYAYKASFQSSSLSPLELNIVSEVPAGRVSHREIREGEAAKIFTGAPIPPGANAVVRIEDTTLKGELVTVNKPVSIDQNIVHAGEEIRKGDDLFPEGFALNAAGIGVLASAGVKEITVYRKPRVGLFSTGSELLDVSEPLAPGKIYNSNLYTLLGLLQEAGCDVTVLPSVPDEMTKTVEALASLKSMDMVISTGGVSVGDYDLVRDGLQEIGAELLFWKIDMKPGTPLCAARRGKQVFFALSGNPAAALVSFELVVRPALQKLKGARIYDQKSFPVKVKGEYTKAGWQRRFLRAKAVLKNGELWADLARMQASGVLLSMTGTDLLVDVPAGYGPVQDGDILQAVWTGTKGEVFSKNVPSWEEEEKPTGRK